MTSPAPSDVWLLTSGSPVHAGSWGLSRAARAEALLSIVCIDTPMEPAVTFGLALSEAEAVVSESTLRLLWQCERFWLLRCTLPACSCLCVGLCSNLHEYLTRRSLPEDSPSPRYKPGAKGAP